MEIIAVPAPCNNAQVWGSYGMSISWAVAECFPWWLCSGFCRVSVSIWLQRQKSCSNQRFSWKQWGLALLSHHSSEDRARACAWHGARVWVNAFLLTSVWPSLKILARQSMSKASTGELRGLKQEVEVGLVWKEAWNVQKEKKTELMRLMGCYRHKLRLLSFWWCIEQQDCLPSRFLVLCFCLPVASLRYILLSSFRRTVVRFSCFWGQLITCKKRLKNKFFRYFLLGRNCSTGDFWHAKRQHEIINWPCKRRLRRTPPGRCFSCV